MNMKSEHIIIQRDMAVTQAEFKRMLSGPVAAEKIQEIKQGFRINTDQGLLDIQFEPLATRTLGSLSILRSLVSYEFHGWTRQQVDDYLAWLDPYFHRGGG